MSPGSTVLKSRRLRGTSPPARASPRSGPGVLNETGSVEALWTPLHHRRVPRRTPAARRDVQSQQPGPGHRGLFLTVTVTQ
jgi:hypothetical protein